MSATDTVNAITDAVMQEIDEHFFTPATAETVRMTIHRGILSAYTAGIIYHQIIETALNKESN